MTEQTSDPVVLPDVDPSARITRIANPVASPGCCVICGKSEHPLGFAATDNLDFEFYGTVYFCADCIGDYARVFGYLSPGDFVELKSQLEAYEKELSILRQAILGLESTVDNMAGELARRSNTTANVVNEPPALSLVSDPVDEPDEELPSNDGGESEQVAEGVSEPDAEQTSGSGPDDLYDTSSADELLGL